MNRSANNIGRVRKRMHSIGCCIGAFVALLMGIGLVWLLPLILDWPTRDEWQIMDEVKRLGGTASFPKMAAAGRVDLRRTKVTDGDLASLDLGRSRVLRSLDLSDTAIGDPGMKYVAQIRTLKYLYLRNTQVTDAGLRELASLPCLEWLDLSGTRVTDNSLGDIARMKRLFQLDIEKTAITDSGLANFRDALPPDHRMYTPPRTEPQTLSPQRPDAPKPEE